MYNKEPTERSSEPKLVSRRKLLGIGAAALAVGGLFKGTKELAEHIANTKLDSPQEKPPVPTGYPLNTVYGDRVDSNEVVDHRYTKEQFNLMNSGAKKTKNNSYI